MEHLIHAGNVHDYAPVGCLENTMVGNDRSGTVDDNLNLLKAVELTLTGGYDLNPVTDALTGKPRPRRRWTGQTPATRQRSTTWEKFWNAYAVQTKHIIRKSVELYEKSESIRARYFQTPYLCCLVKGCAESGMDINEGGRGTGICHHRSRHLRHHGGFPAGGEVSGIRQEGLHHERTGAGIARQLGGA